jgi:hypothetical protein
MKINYCVSVLGALALALLSGNASAATETLDFDLTPTAFSSLASGDISISSFNTNLGILTGIAINGTQDISVSSEVLNVSGSPQSFLDSSAEFSPTLTGPDGSTLLFSYPTITATQSSGGTVNPGTTVVATTSYTQPLTLTLAPTDFTSFETAGSQTLSLTLLSGDGTYSGSPGFPLFYGGDGSATLNGSITYTFTPVAVPEPATWAMMLGGLGMLAFWWRIRFSAGR